MLLLLSACRPEEIQSQAPPTEIGVVTGNKSLHFLVNRAIVSYMRVQKVKGMFTHNSTQREKEREI